MNNPRLIYNNILALPGTTVSASSTFNTSTTNINNILSPRKSTIWRSGARTASSTSVTAHIAVTCAAAVFTAIAIPYSNLNNATLRVRGYTGAAASVGGTADAPTFTAGGSLVFDTGDVTAMPYGTGDLSQPYALGGGSSARLWYTEQAACTSYVITIVDTYSIAATGRYIEISSAILGKVWVPSYGTQKGVVMSVLDTTTQYLSESGHNIIPSKGIRYKKCTIGLDYLSPSDRTTLLKIVEAHGARYPVFLSVFPDNVGKYTMEEFHQLFGTFTSGVPGIAISNYLSYSSDISIQEV